MDIISPSTAAEWDAYYHLRFAVLRQPWQQPPGSERADDDLAPTTTHALVLAPGKRSAVAVGRLHPSGPGQGQLRFMAVHPEWQGQGVGREVLRYLEAAAHSQGLQEIILHARQEAVPFYQRLGYEVVAPSHLLFGTIPHFLMRRAL